MKTAKEWIEEFDIEYPSGNWRMSNEEKYKQIQQDALTEAANIVDQCRGEEGDLRVVRDKIKFLRDEL